MATTTHFPKKRKIPLLTSIILLTTIFGIISLTQVNSQPLPLPTVLPPESTEESDFGPYDPAKFGIPETLAGYKVLAVRSEDNSECMPAGVHEVVIQSSQPTLDEHLESDTATSVQAEMDRLGKPMSSNWFVHYVSPHATIEQFLIGMKRWNSLMRDWGCHQSGPISVEEQDH